jgi:hypothetical protein
MSGGVKQLGMLFVFLGVLGSVFVFRDYLMPKPPSETLSRDEALKRYGFFLEEVAQKSGINFVHQAPSKLDSRLNHIQPIIASMGASVSVVDFNRDGLPDLYVINSGEGSKNCLYRNNGDGTFTDVAEEMGVADLNRPGTGVCMGAIWGDFDSDGYEDLFVYRWGRPMLFRNKGKDKDGKFLGFEDVTDKANLPRWVNANSAVWLDYNRDGNLDLFLAGYWHEDVNLWKLGTTEIMPESFEYANNGGRKYLLRNRGKGEDGEWLGFEDVTDKLGIQSRRWTLGVAATDLCGSGYPDLVLANDYGINEFFANRGGERFEEVGKITRVGDRPKSGMSVSFGDVFNQGRFCIYTTNITESGKLLQWNNLWVPEPGETGATPQYENQAKQLGVAEGGWSWGAQFGDLNNDGRLDLFLTNGYISADPDRQYWHDYSLIAGANGAIFPIKDARNWPAMKGRSLSGFQAKCVWLNRGGKFDDVCKGVGVTDTSDGRAVVLADLWNRGVLDVILANQKGRLLVYKNTVVKERDWVQFELEGTKSNRSAIGAQVKLYWNDEVQVQEVSGGNGYASQNQRRLHFGLGENARLGRAEIRWPSGATQTIPAEQIKIRALNKIKERQ